MIAARQMASVRRQRQAASRKNSGNSLKQKQEPESPHIKATSSVSQTGSSARRIVDVISSVTSSPARSIASTLSSSLPSSQPDSPATKRATNPSNPLASPARRITRSSSPNTVSTSGSPAHLSILGSRGGTAPNSPTPSRQTILTPLSIRKSDGGLPLSYHLSAESCSSLEPVYGGSCYENSPVTSPLSGQKQCNVLHPTSLHISTRTGHGMKQNGASTSSFPPRTPGGLPRFAQFIPTPGSGSQFGALGIWPTPPQGSRNNVKIAKNTVVRTRDNKNTSYLSDYSGSFERPNYGSVMSQMREAYNETESTCDFLRKSYKILGKTITVTICIGILLALPVSMMSVGVKYLEDCPIEPHIPIYLLVGGCFGFFRLVSMMWRQVRSRRFEKMDIYEHDDENGDFISSKSLKFTDAILSIFLFIWFIFGNYWFIKTWLPPFKMDMHEPSKWCDKTCYYFTFIHILICYALILLVAAIFIILFCCHRYPVGLEEE